MRFFGNIIAVFMCVGLILQVSAQAASLPEAEAMAMADCVKMKHHVSPVTKHSDRPDYGHDVPCENMTLNCMLSMNVVAPVLIGNDLPALATEVMSGRLQYSLEATTQMADRSLSPVCPPPRL